MRTSLLLAALALAMSFASITAGCNGNVIVSGKGPGDPKCPATFPDGQACSAEGAQCAYDAAECELTFECVAGQWAVEPAECATPCLGGDPGSACVTVGESCDLGDECSHETWSCAADHTWSVAYSDGGDPCCYGECGCEPFYCPETFPLEGESCNTCPDNPCEYLMDTPCGPQQVTLTCGEDYLWHAAPPACDCSAHLDPESCEADPACRFLSPGCDDPSLDKGGCFAKADCSADVGCPDGKACTTVNANICTIDPCVTCMAVSLCL
jgi:hypothetical protein